MQWQVEKAHQHKGVYQILDIRVDTEQDRQDLMIALRHYLGDVKKPAESIKALYEVLQKAPISMKAVRNHGY